MFLLASPLRGMGCGLFLLVLLVPALLSAARADEDGADGTGQFLT